MGLANSTPVSTENLADWVTVSTPQRSQRNLDRHLAVVEPLKESNQWSQADPVSLIANDEDFVEINGSDSFYHYQPEQGYRDYAYFIQENLDHERMDDYDNLQRRINIETDAVKSAIACDYTLPHKAKSKYHKQRSPTKVTRADLKVTTRRLINDFA